MIYLISNVQSIIFLINKSKASLFILLSKRLLLFTNSFNEFIKWDCVFWSGLYIRAKSF